MLGAVEAAIEPLGEPDGLLHERILRRKCLLFSLGGRGYGSTARRFRSSFRLHTSPEALDRLEAVDEVDDFVEG